MYCIILVSSKLYFARVIPSIQTVLLSIGALLYYTILYYNYYITPNLTGKKHITSTLVDQSHILQSILTNVEKNSFFN